MSDDNIKSLTEDNEKLNNNIKSDIDKNIEQFCLDWSERKELLLIEKYPQLEVHVQELKLSLDESSATNRNFLISFLFIQIYVLVTIFSVTDLDLFYPDRTIALPIVGFSVPITAFFLMAPLFLLLYHFNILFNFSQHSRKLFVWEALNGCSHDDLLLPGFMLNAVLDFDNNKKSIDTILLKFAIFSVLFVIPIGLLFAFQVKYSAFQDQFRTIFHTLIICVDIYLLAIYWDKITMKTVFENRDDSRHAIWSKHCHDCGGLTFAWKFSIVFFSALPLLGLIYLFDYVNYESLKVETESYEVLKLITFTVVAFFATTNILGIFYQWKRITFTNYFKNLRDYFFTVYFLKRLWEKWNNAFIIPIFFFPLLFILALAALSTGTDGIKSSMLLVLLVVVSPLVAIGYCLGEERREKSFIKVQFEYLIRLFTMFLQLVAQCILIFLTLILLRDLPDKFSFFSRLFIPLLIISYNLSFFDSSYPGNNSSLNFIIKIVRFYLLIPIISRIFNAVKAIAARRIVNIFSTLAVMLALINATTVVCINNSAVLTLLNQSVSSPKKNKDGQSDTYVSKGLNPHITVRKAFISKISLNVGLLDLGSIKSLDTIPVEAYEKVDLSGRQFNLIDLSGSILTRANLNGSRMRYGNMQNADFRNATFQEAVLSYASFDSADLSCANFQDADLRGVDFRGAELVNAVFYGSNLRSADFQGLKIHDVNFKEVNFQKVNFRNVSSKNLVFSGADMRNVQLQGAQFEDVNFQKADLRDATFLGTNFKKCNFNYTKVSSEFLRNKSLLSANKIDSAMIFITKKDSVYYCDYEDNEMEQIKKAINFPKLNLFRKKQNKKVQKKR